MQSSACVTTGTWLAAAIATEKLDEFGHPTQVYCRCPGQPRNSHTAAKRKRSATDDAGTESTNAGDGNFTTSSTNDDDLNGILFDYIPSTINRMAIPIRWYGAQPYAPGTMANQLLIPNYPQLTDI